MTGYFRSDVVFPELAAENISKIEFWKSSCEIETADKAEIAKYIEKYKNGEIKAPDQAEKYGIYAVFEEYPVLTYFMGFYPVDAVSPTVSQSLIARQPLSGTAAARETRQRYEIPYSI